MRGIIFIRLTFTLAFCDHMSFGSTPWLPVNYDIMLFVSYTAPVHILRHALSH